MSQPPYPGQPYPNDPSSGQPNQGQPPYQPPSYPPTTPYPSSGQPDYGQPPQYGQQPPQYGQPAGGEYGQQPQYGQPQYGQQPPQYGQQPYGQPAGGFPPPQPPQKKSRTLPIILISVAIVLVLCVGGVTALYMIGRDKADDLEATRGQSTTAPTTAPVTEPTEEPTTEPPSSNISIVEPATLGGRKKLTSAQFKSIADQLKNGLADVPGATNSVGALYGDVADQDIVIVAAAEAPVADPKRELEQTFYGAGIGGLKIDNISNAPTGALGGSAKCGSSETNNIDLAICTWADEGSVGMFIWYFESVSGAKAEFPKLRAQVEKKN
ncbi:MAG: hypothetical protein SYR96_16490 [Actinomycetota bacterium]|nr:hypothetical protein [Actinomycetota bacterium]